MKKVIENKVFFETIIDSLNHKESVSFIVKGNSMKPFLLDQKTEVFLRQKDQYQKKDICLFKKNNQYILHRLIKIQANTYIFRGDHLYQKEYVQAKDILAYVYQFKNHHLVKTNHWYYRLKVNLYLTYKTAKNVLRKIYRGVFHGNK
jgi:hypothetical protein